MSLKFGLNLINHARDNKFLRKLSILKESPLLNCQDKLHWLREDIKQNSISAYERNATQYNLQSKPISYKEGGV